MKKINLDANEWKHVLEGGLIETGLITDDFGSTVYDSASKQAFSGRFSTADHLVEMIKAARKEFTNNQNLDVFLYGAKEDHTDDSGFAMLRDTAIQEYVGGNFEQDRLHTIWTPESYVAAQFSLDTDSGKVNLDLVQLGGVIEKKSFLAYQNQLSHIRDFNKFLLSSPTNPQYTRLRLNQDEKKNNQE